MKIKDIYFEHFEKFCKENNYTIIYNDSDGCYRIYNNNTLVSKVDCWNKRIHLLYGELQEKFLIELILYNQNNLSSYHQMFEKYES